MTTVLILEDCMDSMKALSTIMKEYSVDIHALFASNYKEALTILNSKVSIDLFFLDINLDKNNTMDQSGLLFAKKIREISHYAFTPIVFITSNAELELVSFRETQCYSYLVKPYNKESVIDVLNKVMCLVDNTVHTYLTIKKDGVNYRIKSNDVIYIEAVKRGILIHLVDENVEVKYTSLKQIIEKLPKEQFIQCHRMFIINSSEIDYVDMVNQMIRLKRTKDMIEIGVTYKAELRRWING